MQLFQIGHRFVRATQIRFRYNFEQRSTGPVKIDARAGANGSEIPVNQFSRILLHVYPGYTDPFQLSLNLDVEVPIGADGKFELADLVALREVRVEVVLAREDASLRDGAVGCESGPDGKFHHFLIEDRERSG